MLFPPGEIITSPSPVQAPLVWAALPCPHSSGWDSSSHGCLPYSLSLCKWRVLAQLRRTSDVCTHGQIALFVAELGSDLPCKVPALQNPQCQSSRALANKPSRSLHHLHPPGTEGGTGGSWSPGLAVTNIIS